MTRRGLRFAVAAGLAVAAALVTPASAAERHAVPHGSGSASSHREAPPRSTGAVRHAVPPRAHATGTAHYGYDHGYAGHAGYSGYGWGYDPWWGGGWYGLGWNGCWGWPCYYGPYGAPFYGYYGAYGPSYVITGSAPEPDGPAVIETRVSPRDADVYVDGEIAGYAKDYDGRWDELRLDPGKHQIEFRKSGYRSLVVELNARPGAHYDFDESLALGSGEEHRTVGSAPAAEPPAASVAPAEDLSLHAGIAKGLLRIRVTPQDSGVYLDGEFLGLAGELSRLHGAVPVATGEHRLEVVRPGYVSEVKTVTVEGQRITQVEIALSAAP
jgi:PEGA domain